MENMSNSWSKLPREMHYYRQRLKNRVFNTLVSFFEREARLNGITKKDVAARLDRDPAQITRWLSSPGNLTLESISDILFALEAEAEPPEIVKLKDRRNANYMHPLVASIISEAQAEAKVPDALTITNANYISSRNINFDLRTSAPCQVSTQ